MVLHSVRQHTARLHHRPLPVCAYHPTAAASPLVLSARKFKFPPSGCCILPDCCCHLFGAQRASCIPLSPECSLPCLLLPMLDLASSDCRPARDSRWSVTMMDHSCPETNNQWVLAACACQLGLQNLALSSAGSVRYHTNGLLDILSLACGSRINREFLGGKGSSRSFPPLRPLKNLS